MIPQFILQRPLDIRVTRFAGNVAKEEQRPELLPILIKARDDGHVTSRSVAADLMGSEQGRERIAERMLAALAQNRTLEHRDKAGPYFLTDIGRNAVERNRLFISESGTWEVHYAQDPLLPHGLIALNTHKEPNAIDEARKGAKPRQFREPSRQLLNLRDHPLNPISGSVRVRIDDIPKRVEDVEDLHGTLVWDVGQGRLTLKLDEAVFDLPKPEIAHEDVFLKLLANSGLCDVWDRRHFVLRQDIDSLRDQSRRSMTENVEFPSSAEGSTGLLQKISISGLGEFDPITVRSIPIGAINRDQARHWAQWRQVDHINGVAHAARFAKWTEDAIAPFAEFGQLDMPDLGTLALQALEGSGPEFSDPDRRNLLTAYDWNL